LQNLGNTCFMNSIVQCLNVSLPFSDDLMGLMTQGLEGIPRSLCAVFHGIRGTEAAHGGKGAFSPKALREELISKFPWYSGKEQHDAHELLRTLLGSISDETTKAELKQAKEAGGKPPAEEAPGSCGVCVSRSFRGHIFAATLCWGCGRVSLRLDPFLDISLDLPALAGQAVGALGVTPAMASGEPTAPPAGAPEEEEEEQADGSGAEERGGSKAERKERRRRGKAHVEAAARSKPRPGPKGIWASRSEAEEEREHVRQLVIRLVVRALQSESTADAGAEDEAVEDEPVTAEVELTRQSKKLQPNWGFKWSEAGIQEGSFVLTGVKEDSVLEKWNLKCRAIGDDELIICVGDRLIEVNGLTEVGAMRKTLKSEDRVSLKFVRGRGSLKASEPGGSRDESDHEAERKAQAAAAKEALRKEFCETATRCHGALPPPLRDLFGPEKVAQEANGHLKLEDCLRRFSVVEALEDDFKPVYRCSECSKVDSSCKTYASRRMWLWQADLPPLMTLQLKRFRRYLQRFEKSAASIALPTVLDLGDFVLAEQELQSLQPFVAPSGELRERPDQGKAPEGGGGASALRYELYGICVHKGSTMARGHYVAYVNGGASLEREAWFGISDAQVWSCPRAEVLKAEAYIAFYRREGRGEAVAAAHAAKAGAEGKTEVVREDEESLDAVAEEGEAEEGEQEG